VPALEGLRGYAALLIVVYHAWVLSGQGRLGAPLVRDGISAGLLAVDVFFVLSAFERRPGAVRDLLASDERPDRVERRVRRDRRERDRGAERERRGGDPAPPEPQRAGEPARPERSGHGHPRQGTGPSDAQLLGCASCAS
jgi:hypothetical protein